MNIIVVGCGRVGAELATRLSKSGHKVTVLDITPNAFTNLPTEFRGRTIEGEALNQDVLRRAGIETADGVAVVTSSDSINAVVGHIARSIFNTPVVVVRNYDSRWRSMQEVFEHQLVSSSSWGAQRVEELLYHQAGNTVFSAGNGEVELYEFSIDKNWDGRKLAELLVNGDTLAAAVTRAGAAMLPSNELVIKEGDVLLVSATFKGSLGLRERLGLTSNVKKSLELNDQGQPGFNKVG